MDAAYMTKELQEWAKALDIDADKRTEPLRKLTPEEVDRIPAWTQFHPAYYPQRATYHLPGDPVLHLGSDGYAYTIFCCQRADDGALLLAKRMW